MLQSRFRFPNRACSAIGVFCLICVPTTVDAQTAVERAMPTQDLSAQALDALVAGIAFFDDRTIEHILIAAQNPEQIRHAAMGTGGIAESESLQYLAKYPDLLTQLDQQLPLTARLGLAAKTQLDEVWQAVDRVRAGFEESQQKSVDDLPPPSQQGYVTTTYAPPGYGYYAAGLWAGAAINELRHEYQQAFVAHPGAVVYGGGAAGISVEQVGTGYQTNSAAAGAIYNPATGYYAAGVHQGSGYAQANADGTTSFGHQGTTSVHSSYGNTDIQHQSSGTAAGIGNSSYSGSTQIDSTHGVATIETQAGGGEISSTISTQNGTQTLTAGDGTVGSSAAESTTRTSDVGSRSSSFARPSDRFSEWSSLSETRSGLAKERPSTSKFSRPTTTVNTNSLPNSGSRYSVGSPRVNNGHFHSGRSVTSSQSGSRARGGRWGR
ncbi:hypothetical protein [Roseiconus lacunae]|uniref:hypothetical protein n=1 Tax=Roseiconus lacunae TaxID=2605694 RepID=UPI001E314F52|nr:hypothetical protein [Roseiconus lacunae]MCD0462925.1 hypothetical protein [Roseiconus lacunae]